ncbi:MAG TPA: antibiotic biosynthesis monooxygenase [Acetobacteraceae bacterium]|nr:antibiotic biosynthesis monooxygenase [Acetobacteraceae bacterium]
MTAFNVVRFRVKPGLETEFIEAHRRGETNFAGARRFHVVKAAGNSFFVIGEWDSMEAMAAARPMMIAVLDSFRHTLEDLGGGLGVTDPISGTAVLEITPGH